MARGSSVDAGLPAIRRVALPGGQTLVLRPVSVDDVDVLVEMHDGLSLGDLRRLFFSTVRPTRTSLEGLATANERGGFGVAADMSESGLDRGRLVGVAGYEPLPDGDGELSIIAAPEWREWLGRLLLHVVLEAAASRGVPNLEADVLLTNQSLLALARARGCAFMDSDKPWSVRCVIGTRGPTPTWPGPHDRPRVLVEAPAGAWRADPAYRAAGWQVLVCPGPGERPCPALHGQPCALAAAADAIVIAPPRPDERWDALPDAHRSQHPGVPLCVTLAATPTGRPDQVVQLPDDPGDARAAVALVDRAAREHARGADGWLGDAGAQPPDRTTGT